LSGSGSGSGEPDQAARPVPGGPSASKAGDGCSALPSAQSVILILASDRVSAGERADKTAQLLRESLAAAALDLIDVIAVPDEQDLLEQALRAAVRRSALVLTSGGTGLAPRDVTPEATRAVIEREVPGLGEAMRAASRAQVPTADLSRALAGSLGGSLVVNLPGSPKGAQQCLDVVLPAVKHAIRLLAGTVKDCATEVGEA
jgi:molybdopterin adenylyltransferase